jgi:hypothetical protein
MAKDKVRVQVSLYVDEAGEFFVKARIEGKNPIANVCSQHPMHLVKRKSSIFVVEKPHKGKTISNSKSKQKDS